MKKYLFAGVGSLLFLLTHAQEDTTLVYTSFHDSMAVYRTYATQDMANVSPVYFPRMENAVIERQITFWLNYDQEAYMSVEIESFDYRPADFEIPHKVIIGPDGAKAFNESGELLTRESTEDEVFKSYYNNVVSSLLSSTPEMGFELPEVSHQKIEEFQDRGYIYSFNNSVHRFRSSTAEFSYDPDNFHHQIRYFDPTTGELTRSVEQYYGKNAENKYYAALEITKRYGTDQNGHCFVDNKVRVKSKYRSYVSPYLESFRAQNEDVALYPNPAEENFSVDFLGESDVDFRRVQIIHPHTSDIVLDVSGDFNEASEFDVSDVPRGVYIVKITRYFAGDLTTYNLNLQIQ